MPNFDNQDKVPGRLPAGARARVLLAADASLTAPQAATAQRSAVASKSWDSTGPSAWNCG